MQLIPFHLLVHQAVAAMTAELTAHGDVEKALTALDAELRGSACDGILDRAAGTRSELLDAVRHQLSDGRAGLASNPLSAASRVQILLLQQIDVAWWSDIAPYEDQRAVDRAPELLRLPELQQRGALRFRYTVQPVGWWGRGRDYVLKRVQPRRRPPVAGMKFLIARAEIVALLNEIAEAFGERAPAGTPPLWVNSMVRSVEHQRHLGDLGYFALLPSSHCSGYAVDVEMTWYESFGAADVLQALLLEYRDRGVLNVIDEGQAWHLCLNPEHVDDYAAAARELRG